MDLARTPEDLRRCLERMDRADVAGLRALRREGATRLVDNDAPVEILDRGEDFTRLRVVEGPQAGAEGWTRSDWVVRGWPGR